MVKKFGAFVLGTVLLPATAPALANGNWYWTSTPTPNAANKISATGSPKKSSSSKNGSGSKTTASGSTSGDTDSASDAADLQPAPIHPAVLALVAGLALLYGAYEYRQDLANRYRQLQRYRAARRGARAKS